MATGHYVRMERDGATGRCLLKKALHPEKDQSYVVVQPDPGAAVPQPIPPGGAVQGGDPGHCRTAGLRQRGEEGEPGYLLHPRRGLCRFPPPVHGEGVPSGALPGQNGRRLGTHEGIVSYTVGQRRGLGISSEGRLYVKELRPEDNAVVLSDNAALFTRVLTADRLNLIPTDSLSAPIRAKARIRYRQQEQPCTIEQTGPDTVRVEFDQPQRAVTPGQAVVFYDGDLVIGGATIQKGRES